MAILLLGTAAAASAQVRVTSSWSDYRPFEQVRARIHNETAEPITYCVEYAQRSPAATFVESTPTPFVIEQSNFKREWQIIMNVPDAASARAPVVLDAGKSADFMFRVGSGGWIRLLLYYWRGAQPNLNCGKAPRDKKNVRSDAFLVWGAGY